MLLPGLPHCEPEAVLLAVIVGRLVIAVVGRHGVVPEMLSCQTANKVFGQSCERNLLGDPSAMSHSKTREPEPGQTQREKKAATFYVRTLIDDIIPDRTKSGFAFLLHEDLLKKVEQNLALLLAS